MDSTDFALLMPKLEDISTWQRRGDPVFDIDAANVYYSRQIDFHPATHDPIVKHFEPLAILGLWRSSLCLYSPGPGLCRSSFLSAKTSNPTSHFSEIAACAPVCRAPIVETFDECAPLPKLCAKVDRNSGYNPITVGHKLLDYAGYPSLGLHSIGTNAQPAKYQRYEPLTFEDGPDRTCNSFFDPSPSIGQAHRVQPPPSAPTKSQVTFVLAPHLRHSSPSEPKIGSASPPKPSVICKPTYPFVELVDSIEEINPDTQYFENVSSKPTIGPALDIKITPSEGSLGTRAFVNIKCAEVAAFCSTLWRAVVSFF